MLTRAADHQLAKQKQSLPSINKTNLAGKSLAGAPATYIISILY